MSEDPDDTFDPRRPSQHGRRTMMRSLNDALEVVLKVVQVLSFSAMTGLVTYEVIMRYGFNSPTVWSESAARLAMIWLVLLGMALSIRYREHIRVDFFLDHLSERWQRALGYLRIFTVVIIALVLLFAGYSIAVANMSQIAPGIGIPVFWKYLAVPVSAAVCLAFLLEKLLSRDTRPF